MTPEQQRIAIAEACGYEEIVRTVDSRKELSGTHPHWMTTVHHGERKKQFKTIPDYLNDLNEMIKAQDFLSDDQWKDYIVELGGRDTSWNGGRDLLSATAKQRAEPFLRAVGKWTE